MHIGIWMYFRFILIIATSRQLTTDCLPKIIKTIIELLTYQKGSKIQGRPFRQNLASDVQNC